MTTLCHFTLTVTLQGPVLTKSSSPSSFGVDAAVARDFVTGVPCLPGTLIKGKIREALAAIGEPETELNRLFGRDTEQDSDHSPARGRLHFEDLKISPESPSTAEVPSPKSRITRVAIEQTLGSAKGEMLRTIESPFAPSARVDFSGFAKGFFAADELETVRRKLACGLGFLSQIGSLRTTGFGRLLDVRVLAQPAGDEPSTPITDAPASLDLKIHPNGPLCIAGPKIGGNLYESAIVIPGNMLAGAVQQTAAALGIPIPHFNEIRFRHAFPTSSERRPRVLPLSTVKADTSPYDVSNCPGPVLLMAESGAFTAPKFPIDWKEHQDVLNQLDWAEPVRELRVRTAIDPERRAAKVGIDDEGGSLFAWEMIHPWDRNDQPIHWRTRIDLARIPESERHSVALALEQVLRHLGFLSKTKTYCRVEIEPITREDAVSPVQPGECLRLALQSPALLVDPRFQPGQRGGALDPGDLFALYRQTWDALSGNSLKLSHYFAQQHLVGGNHLAIRFQRQNQNAWRYDPWLLTSAGSVFVFCVEDPALAEGHLNRWLRQGLELPGWARDRFGGVWDRNPYIPQNGFGEIAVHHPEFATPEFQTIELIDPILP